MSLNLRFIALILGLTSFQFAVNKNSFVSYMTKYDPTNAKFGGIRLTW